MKQEKIKCPVCKYIGYWYGIPTGQGVTAPFCQKCGNNIIEKKLANTDKRSR